MKKMSDANWKLRKEGLDELSDILEKSQFNIKYNFCKILAIASS